MSKKQYSMKKGAKKRWLEALESGKYRQTRGRMTKRLDDQGHYGYCCLGVLHDIEGDSWEERLSCGRTVEQYEDMYGHIPEHFDLNWHAVHGHDTSSSSCRSDVSLPESLMDEVRMSEDLIDELVELNDLEKYNFKEIAQWIRENVKGV